MASEFYQVFDIFLDPDLTQKVEYFDVGKCEAGLETVKQFWIKNVSDYVVSNIEFNFDNEQFKVIKVPDKVNPGEAGEVHILVNPSIRIKEPLKAKCQMRMTEESPVRMKMNFKVTEQQQLEELAEEYEERMKKHRESWRK